MYHEFLPKGSFPRSPQITFERSLWCSLGLRVVVWGTSWALRVLHPSTGGGQASETAQPLAQTMTRDLSFPKGYYGEQLPGGRRKALGRGEYLCKTFICQPSAMVSTALGLFRFF